MTITNNDFDIDNDNSNYSSCAFRKPQCAHILNSNPLPEFTLQTQRGSPRPRPGYSKTGHKLRQETVHRNQSKIRKWTAVPYKNHI